mmetsp:Transcript_20034/g.53184  ORF Transcript_20034/g.53184 Transcript_20034/m.53184 type:complete len:334 (-) Transcript_20034:145-1146(-)
MPMPLRSHTARPGLGGATQTLSPSSRSMDRLQPSGSSVVAVKTDCHSSVDATDAPPSSRCLCFSAMRHCMTSYFHLLLLTVRSAGFGVGGSGSSLLCPCFVSAYHWYSLVFFPTSMAFLRISMRCCQSSSETSGMGILSGGCIFSGGSDSLVLFLAGETSIAVGRAFAPPRRRRSRGGSPPDGPPPFSGVRTPEVLLTALPSSSRMTVATSGQLWDSVGINSGAFRFGRQDPRNERGRSWLSVSPTALARRNAKSFGAWVSGEAAPRPAAPESLRFRPSRESSGELRGGSRQVSSTAGAASEGQTSSSSSPSEASTSAQRHGFCSVPQVAMSM